mmetsp:Transcript_26451/g.67159  ORF Transcript_26451/g.67159 Transcript_26451/m.67159 type:complete len:91 (-) Transcript_26451:83-355(-)
MESRRLLIPAGLRWAHGLTPSCGSGSGDDGHSMNTYEAVSFSLATIHSAACSTSAAPLATIHSSASSPLHAARLPSELRTGGGMISCTSA